MSWTDQEFPANFSSLQQSGCDNETVTWRRAKELCPTACIRGHIISAPAQGQLGDCWLLTAFHALAQCEFAWKKVFGSYDNDFVSGKIVVNLWVDGRWEQVLIDDYLPVYQTNGCLKLLNAYNVDECQFWASFLEKACAKKFGCYMNLVSGQPSEAFLLVTGGYTWTEKLPHDVPFHACDSLQRKIQYFRKNKTVDSVFLNSKIPSDDENSFDYHCYCFVLSKDDAIHLWNPFTLETKPVSDVVGTLLEQSKGPPCPSTVTFATTSLVRVFGTGECAWDERFIHGEWNASSSGGSIASSTYSDNPQYVLCIKSIPNKLVIHVTLMQPSKRDCVERKMLLQAIGIHLFKIPSRPPRKLNERQLKGLDCIALPNPSYQYFQNVSVYVCLRCCGETGMHFLIVPSTYSKNVSLRFAVRVTCTARSEIVSLANS